MLDSQKFQVESVARMFRVPLHMIQVSTPGAMSYASVEQNSINFVTHTLRPYIEKIEYAYSTLLPNEAFLKFNVDGLLRGDFTTRIQGYSLGLQAGFYSVNDVRRFEDLRPVDSGDQHRVPFANINLSEADVVEQDKRVSMATRLVQTGFDPAQVLSALGLPKISHTGVPSTQLQQVVTLDPLIRLRFTRLNNESFEWCYYSWNSSPQIQHNCIFTTTIILMLCSLVDLTLLLQQVYNY
jgi:hypothetical protein